MSDSNIEVLPEEIQKIASRELWDLVETDLKYEGYVKRQLSHNQYFIRNQTQPIPKDIDYSQIGGLRLETRQKLSAIRPDSIGKAIRVSGITPTDVSIISIWLEKNRFAFRTNSNSEQ